MVGIAVNARDEILARLRTALADRPAAGAGPPRYRPASTSAADLVDTAGRPAGGLPGDRPPWHRRPASAARRGRPARRRRPTSPPDWLAGYAGRLHRRRACRCHRPPGRRWTRSLTGCAVAVAETGTIVLDAGPAQGRRALTLVPDRHICVVRTDQVVGLLPEALARLDPTRAADLDLRPVRDQRHRAQPGRGSHGPRRLEIVLISSGA